jgi:para-nitrobenzyl esterase
MHRRCAISVAFMAITMVVPAVAERASTTVTIDAGVIEGAVSNDIIYFKGIPYASAPIGNLRWLPPQPVMWTNVRSAKEFGSDCLQMDILIPTVHHGSDDCLFLNVWRPADKTSADERLPVIVWVHGGGYVIGGTSDRLTDGQLYDGSALARQGLVVVSLNYRLGRLGFFAHPALIAASGRPSGYSGNFGLMDQIRALEWVRTNIGKFGGDPGQVTLVGESAGGVSITHLLTSLSTKGLFHRVIIMSGGGRHAPLLRAMTDGTPDQPSADKIDADFAEKTFGIQGSGTDALAALRTRAALDFIKDVTFASVMLKVWLHQPQSGTAMIDRGIVSAEPGYILCRNGAISVPVIIGTTASDLAVIFPPRKEPYPYSYFGADAGDAMKVYGPNAIEAIGLVAVDITMHEAARFVAKFMTAAGNKVWLYRFTYVSQAEDEHIRMKGAAHAAELPYLFQTLDKKYANVSDDDWRMARAFSGYFANFAKSSDADPNAGELTSWRKFDPANFQLMNFVDPRPIFGDDPLKKRVALVEKVSRCP